MNYQIIGGPNNLRFNLFPDLFGLSRRLGVAGGAALQAVWRCRRCGVTGGAAVQVVRRCRRFGVAGGAALQAVSESPRRRAARLVF